MPVGSVGMGLLAILAEDESSYGLRLRNEFESRTGGVWPLNVGQVYTTLARLERDGLVREVASETEGQRPYQITEQGQEALRRWFLQPASSSEPPAREELAMKVALAARSGVAEQVIQAERKAAVQRLQRYIRLRTDSSTGPEDGSAGDIGWMFLLDSLMFQTEATVRWLEACEARLTRIRVAPPSPRHLAIEDPSGPPPPSRQPDS